MGISTRFRQVKSESPWSACVPHHKFSCDLKWRRRLANLVYLCRTHWRVHDIVRYYIIHHHTASFISADKRASIIRWRRSSPGGVAVSVSHRVGSKSNNLLRRQHCNNNQLPKTIAMSLRRVLQHVRQSLVLLPRTHQGLQNIVLLLLLLLLMNHHHRWYNHHRAVV